MSRHEHRQLGLLDKPSPIEDHLALENLSEKRRHPFEKRLPKLHVDRERVFSAAKPGPKQSLFRLQDEVRSPRHHAFESPHHAGDHVVRKAQPTVAEIYERRRANLLDLDLGLASGDLTERGLADCRCFSKKP